MIVIVIIGVLAALAIPRFIKTAERVKGDEAVTKLRLIFTGEGMFRVDNNSYTGDLDDLTPDYIVDPRGGPYWTYGDPDTTDDPLDPGPDFTATATRSGGVYSGGTITIDEDENITTDDPWPFTY